MHVDLHRLPSRRTPRLGFTLVEVMISIAIALILILGISQIFGLAQRTTGAGAQVLAAGEYNRSIQSTFLGDVRNIDNSVNSPGIVIISYPQAAFRTMQDQQQDRDGIPQTYNNPNSATASIAEQIWRVDDRIHRTDVLCFFAHGQFSRRTGNRPFAGYPNPSLISTLTSEDALIWYGHLALPDNATLKAWNYLLPQNGVFFNPGSGTSSINPNNFFASNWILGRQVVLLAEAPVEPAYTSTTANPDPLSMFRVQHTPDNVPLYASRYDLANTSIPAYYAFWNPPGSPSSTWWQALSGLQMGGASPPLTITRQRRYYANPFVQKPATTGVNASQRTQELSSSLAQSAPVFVRGCTQFIVEFAGDFVTQNSTGAITAAAPDGQIDYVVDPTTGARQTRWYGFPRDTTGTGVIDVNHGVLPLGAVMNFTNPAPLEFERTVPATPAPSSAQSKWITNPPAKNVGWTTNNNGATNGLPWVYGQPYVCAWGADTDAQFIPRPKMLRITVAVDDPTGHLNTEQVYEYVLDLP